MNWPNWAYFNGQWQCSPKLDELRKQRAKGAISRSEYKNGILLIQQAVLKRMLQEGRITENDVKKPGPPQPQKTQKPFIGKKVSINKALPAHGKAHRPATLFKYTSEVPGGLPGHGKKR